MTDAERIDEIRSLILNNKKPSYKTTNGKEIRVRCPYCGDSRSNPNDAHFYISMRPPFMFHCFKCETSGVLNSEVLRDLEIFDQQLNVGIVSANKNYKENSGIQKINTKKIHLNNQPVFSEKSFTSLQYFQDRFNETFTIEELSKKFKVITDPVQFFQNNNITVNYSLFDYNNAVGFISSDSSHLIFRDIGGQSKMRYNNLNLYGNENITFASKIYNISNDIDIMAPEVELVITEGIFDIIGVYNHFYKENDQNKIFAAACGKAYYAVILNYIRMGFLNLKIKIFSDADVPLYFFKNMKNSSPYLKNSQIQVYYNTLEKDFGIPKNKIQLKYSII